MGQVTSVKADGSVEKQDFADFASNRLANMLYDPEESKANARHAQANLIKNGTRMKDWTAKNYDDSLSCAQSPYPCNAIQESVCGFDLIHLGIGPTVDVIKRDSSFMFVKPRRLVPGPFGGCEMIDELDLDPRYLIRLMLDAGPPQTVNGGQEINTKLIEELIFCDEYETEKPWRPHPGPDYEQCLMLLAACTGHTVQLIKTNKYLGEVEPDAPVKEFKPDKYSSGVLLQFRAIDMGWNFWSRKHVGPSTWPKEEVPITVHDGPEVVLR